MNSCTHDLDVVDMSHTRIDPSCPPDIKVKPLGSISSAVTPSRCAGIVNTQSPIKIYMGVRFHAFENLPTASHIPLFVS